MFLAVFAGGEVDGCGFDRGVAEEGAYVADVGAGTEEFGGAGVAQGVRVAQLRGELGGGAEAFEDVGEDFLVAPPP
ncbi:MAG TPA: hypothetical protein VIJ33_08410 [Solirubrobacteraceae bacterium]